MSGVVRRNGFTNETLGWTSWLTPVDPEQASPAQAAVLDMSHPQARSSDYYLTLVHQPELLRQRSRAYNSIMYAPRGLPRADRELGALTVSCINGCVYCASVHAQRFEQHARQTDTVEQVFENPHGTGRNARERAVTRFAARITEDPAGLNAADIQALKKAGLPEAEILDLLHATAVFAWANRLMMNLGQTLSPDGAD